MTTEKQKSPVICLPTLPEPIAGEEMEQIWKRYQDSSSAQNPAIYYHSDEHWYRVMFQTKNIEGISYYTITNQRLGRILLDVTKEWIDGDGTRRDRTARSS